MNKKEARDIDIKNLENLINDLFINLNDYEIEKIITYEDNTKFETLFILTNPKLGNEYEYEIQMRNKKIE